MQIFTLFKSAKTQKNVKTNHTKTGHQIIFGLGIIGTPACVWTKRSNNSTFQYIEQLWKYLQAHQSKFHPLKSIICGDFNSNACWDKQHRWNHSEVVNDLAKLNIHSVYHHLNNIGQGKETLHTFYLHRKIEKPYHIDYAFVSSNLLSSASFEIGNFNEWILLSDHMPIIFELD